MTNTQRLVAASMLSASVMLAFVAVYLFLREQPMLAGAVVILVPVGTLRLARYLQGLSPVEFHGRGLLFGFCASLGATGVIFREARVSRYSAWTVSPLHGRPQRHSDTSLLARWGR